MDPIGAITKITGGVLRRIADAIDDQPATEQGVTIHIETLHVHGTPAVDLPFVDVPGRTVRNRIFGRS